MPQLLYIYNRGCLADLITSNGPQQIYITDPNFPRGNTQANISGVTTGVSSARDLCHQTENEHSPNAFRTWCNVEVNVKKIISSSPPLIVMIYGKFSEIVKDKTKCVSFKKLY